MHPDVGPIVPCPLALPPERPLSFPGRQAAVPTVLIVARILRAESYKGHDQLLECWPAVTAQVPSARLVVVGEGDDVVRLREKASALGLGPTSVVFTGFVSANELDTWYSEAWVFAMPSRGEGFGLVYLEAMAHGVPCIGSCEDAAGDVIVDGETGYLVEQADTASLAERLGRLLRDPSLCRELGEQGRRRVMSEFSYDQFSRRLEAAIVDAFGPSAWNGAPPKTAPAH